MTRLLFIAIGSVSLALAALGAVLPLLPATPFVILSGICFSRSSPRLHSMVQNHSVFGPVLENWRLHRAISRRTKCAAMIALSVSWFMAFVAQVPAPVLAVQSAVLLGVAGFILMRPSPPTRDAASANALTTSAPKTEEPAGGDRHSRQSTRGPEERAHTIASASSPGRSP